MIINENCWQYCQYPQSWQLYLLKFVQVVHEIDMSFLHLHVSIILSHAAQLELCLADCVHQRCCAAETRTVWNFFPQTLMRILF